MPKENPDYVPGRPMYWGWSRYKQTNLVHKAVETLFPGWGIKNCANYMNPGLYDEMFGKKKVLLTHPLDKETGCMLYKQVKIPEAKQTTLQLVVGHHPNCDWVLIVRVDNKELLSMPVGKETATEKNWMDVSVDLTAYAGKTVNLQLVNQPSGWNKEAGYWNQIKLVSK